MFGWFGAVWVLCGVGVGLTVWWRGPEPSTYQNNTKIGHAQARIPDGTCDWMVLAVTTTRLSLDAAGLDAPSVLGICVTGEARTFEHQAVRASLQNLIEVNAARLVRFDLTQRHETGCSSFREALNNPLCESNSHMNAFNLSSADLQREFPTAHIELHDLNECVRGAGACCSPNLCRGAPAAFLQYHKIARCISRVARDGAPLGVTHVLRTRPDAVYYPPLDRTPLFTLLPPAPIVFARREHGLQQVSDHFFLVHVRGFTPRSPTSLFHNFMGLVEGACSQAVINGVRLYNGSARGTDCRRPLDGTCGGCLEGYLNEAIRPSERAILSLPALLCRPQWYNTSGFYEDPATFYAAEGGLPTGAEEVRSSVRDFCRYT